MTQSYIPTRKNGKLILPVEGSGQQILRNPFLNKGSGFPRDERITFGLDGILPPYVLTLEEQMGKVRETFDNKPDNITKYIYLRSLQDRNETAFYAFCHRNILDILPIIYTPTVGEAVKKYGQLFRISRGLFITPYNIDRFDEIVADVPTKNIEMIVVTDSQGVLGIGDQGVGGMAISIGKLSIYTIAAGFHPSLTMPIVLDVGTDNEILLADPYYLGLRERRISGDAYDVFIKKFVEGIKRNFPGAVLQWEDFSKQNAFNNMDRYKDVLPSFNDDIQGTAAVTVGGILGAMKIKNEKISQQKFMIYGAGAAGIGIARQIHNALVVDGLSDEEARLRIYVADSQGLILNNRKNLDEYKKEFALDPSVVASWNVSGNTITMADVVREGGVTVLIGVSGQPGSFDKTIVDLMMKNTPEPVIFPLSNPNSLSEADPGEILQMTGGKAIVAAGSPFPSVTVNHQVFEISQGNNAFVFPGVGLGVVAAGATRITPEVFSVAASALAESVSEKRLSQRSVYPSIGELFDVSVKVALAVFAQCRKEGSATVTEGNMEDLIRARVWTPEYPEYIKA